MTTYKIGTRGSLLAVTQSTLIKNQLESLSGESFELVLIKTQGDQITNKPLWQLEGKDFFTKELDEALLKNEVDFVIHSYKDLGSIRPEGIKLAAVTQRRFAHDILLMPKDLKVSGELIVGTSSPRRITNLTKSLANFLPGVQSIKCETLRGNVNSRIKKLKMGEYQAITLALAGIERLAHKKESAEELASLIEGLNYFILPQSVFPSAASQGALGIEMNASRNDGGKLAGLLSQLAHEVTIQEVQRERAAFKEYGGGCHLAVGIHVKKVGDNFLHVHAGEVDGHRIEKKWLEKSALKNEKFTELFVGLPHGEQNVVYDEFLLKKPISKKLDLAKSQVFVTSRYCLETLKASNAPLGVWAAGTKTAQQLAQAGIWVNGTADSLGTEDLKAFCDSKVLNMFHSMNNWKVLTHPDSVSDLGEVVGCYERVEANVSPEWNERLQKVGACFWTSFPQFDAYTKKFPQLLHAKHFCGLGKTLQEFDRAKVAVTPVASMQEFYDLKKDSL